MLFLLVATNFYAINDSHKSNVITYNVVKNNTIIGTIKINKQTFKDSITYTLESNIEARYILKFKITGEEKSIYKDDILMYSSVFRTVNNKLKTNHSISLNNGRYKLQSSKEIRILDFDSITHNLITMYFKEPIGLQNIFCDNLSQMVPVKAIRDGIYRVEFSKDKYNIFHYENGECFKIEAFSPLFDVTLIPV
ncbi:DUF6134 family protein [Flaviramulus basaltis]|nr:DUF6134 family protein [Flaviramulus basaltis]